MARVQGQDLGLRVTPPPLFPAGGDDGQAFQLQPEAHQGAHDGNPLQGRPEGVGLAVVHQLVGTVEEAAGPETELTLPHLLVVEDGGAAQSAVGTGDVDSADLDR